MGSPSELIARMEKSEGMNWFSEGRCKDLSTSEGLLHVSIKDDGTSSTMKREPNQGSVWNSERRKIQKEDGKNINMQSKNYIINF